ncbi:MAG: hypothetical protein J07HX64_02144 [halophilic archaeon J07HX64]|nr:MAG: hypothetical protein J07HX64_02144 [halophilic archaeon J07HX64]
MEPKAPCVEVCESPHATVIPGRDSPSSGATTWVIPCLPESSPKNVIPLSVTFRSSAESISSASLSTRGRSRFSASVGAMWSVVA